jgi:hypothetical protein
MNRYSEYGETFRHNGDGKLRYSTLYYPDIPKQDSDQYIISKKLDRMDLIAHTWYSDAKLWWVIQRANNLPGGTLQIPPGTQIRIPWPLPVYELQTLITNEQF